MLATIQAYRVSIDGATFELQRYTIAHTRHTISPKRWRLRFTRQARIFALCLLPPRTSLRASHITLLSAIMMMNARDCLRVRAEILVPLNFDRLAVWDTTQLIDIYIYIYTICYMSKLIYQLKCGVCEDLER